ncbi:MAG: hypothetical protein USCGTAYLOR_03024 [Chromatiales bacterium USCg_Taylor]|nr:MAG: hypothetical protein USCGTAYLOR_03024 [Chromatiales bacterium USCg_Taylor]
MEKLSFVPFQELSAAELFCQSYQKIRVGELRFIAFKELSTAQFPRQLQPGYRGFRVALT